MIKLRKILLCNYLYYLIFLISIINLLISLNLPKISKYSQNDNYLTGIVVNKFVYDDKIVLYVNGLEKVICTSNELKYSNISLGDRVFIKGKFVLPSSNTVDGVFNYKKYLERKKIFYIVKIKQINIIKKNRNIYYYLKNRLFLIDNPYFAAFLLGDKHYLSKNMIRSYQDNGISHLFAISGMHIALLSSFIKKVFSIIKCSEEQIFKITTIFFIFYLLFIQVSPSIIRGILFYFFFSFNRIYYTYIKKENLLLLIFSISLIINPNNVFDVSFLYSYTISMSLVLFNKYLFNSNYFIGLLKTSILSFFVSMPISLYFYNQINIMSIIYNLFYVPLISIIIFPLSFICFIFKPFIFIYDFFINILERTSVFLSKISFGKIIFKKVPFFIYIIYFVIIIFILLRPRKLYVFLILIMLLCHYFLPFFDCDYIDFIDVGQGDSILFHCSNKNILVDTGGSYDSDKLYSTLFSNFKVKGITNIHYLIISHGDYDHMGEAINLVNNFKVEKVIFNCGPYNDLEKELIKVLDNKKIKYYSCIQELNVDNNKLYFLQTKEYDNENDNSNVIYTELNGYKFMFMGDAGVEKEKDILDKYSINNIDVLKVGHHGSKTSSGKEFIEEINPKYSIISVGKNNRYGHPNKEVLDNLKNSKIYRTDQDGSIMFKIKNKKLKIETCSP